LYIKTFKKNEIKISLDGKGRALGNVFIERFWRSLKQEKIYFNPPNGSVDLFQKIKDYVHFYNTERRHTEIGSVPPDELFYNQKMVG
jgi:putative transposase